MKRIFLGLVLVVGLFSCTENQRAKVFGGTMKVALDKPNEVFINATWKQNNLWILTKDTTTGIHYFREYSNFGLVEGEVVIK